MADWHSEPLARVLERLKSSVDGLTEHDIEQRLDRYSRNELQVGADTPEIVNFLLFKLQFVQSFMRAGIK